MADRPPSENAAHTADEGALEPEVLEVVELEQEDLGLELPDDPEAAISMLVDEVEALRQERDSYLADLQRVAADYDNFRKRIQRDKTELIAQATRRVVESMLPTLDAFDAAATHQPQTEGEEQLLAGLLSTRQQLMEVLSREGLEPVHAVGEAFDPNLHEAISVAGEGDHQIVDSEIRKGYKLGDRVLRPALVALSAEVSRE